ncbi:MAG: DegV family protein [Bacteroidota bacterium]|nr:DegV family protein [Bacteroidota bacterium]
MKHYKIQMLDGKNLYYSFLSGAKKIIEHQKELNKLNVFPVPDADTGTNMASTIRSVVERIRPNRCYKTTADAIADAALDGARGNSGVIFAQFLYGMSAETSNCQQITIDSFAESAKRSVQYIYDAIANPIEGTILTVIREWADYIYANKNKLDDFVKLLTSSLEIANKSLLETANRIKNISVVDAGAKGFVLFLEGIIEWIKSSDIREVLQFGLEHAIEETVLDTDIHENITFRYCTEAMMRDCSLSAKEVRELINDMGDSIVIAGSPKLLRLHIHTDNPQDVFVKLSPYGTLTYQKGDDMRKQYEAAHARKWNIALVTDSGCDLPSEIFDQYQIHFAPINIYFGENHYLDKVTLTPEHFFNLLEKGEHWPTSAQVKEKTFENLYSHLASHYDSIIAVHVSSKFSGTWNTSRLAAETIGREMNKKITVIDSGHLSGTEGLVTLRIAQAIEAGLDHDTIVSQAEEWKKKTRILVSVKSLHNIIKGGRISPMKGFIANLLGLKPVITTGNDGGLTMLSKTFTQKANMKKVMKEIANMQRNNKFWNYIVLHVRHEEAASFFAAEMEKLTGRKPFATIDVTPIMGLNAGKEAVGVALMTE